MKVVVGTKRNRVNVAVADNAVTNVRFSKVTIDPKANLALAEANLAYTEANLALVTVNTAVTQASTATNIANLAYAASNTAIAEASAASNTANNASNVANAAFGGSAAAAFNQANAAYAQANIAYSTANAAYGQANIAYSTANSAYVEANIANTQANLAYARANLGIVNVSSGNTDNLIVSTNGSNIIIDTIGTTNNYNVLSGNTITAGNLLLGAVGIITNNTGSTTANATGVIVDTFATSQYNCVKYLIQITSTMGLQATEILCIQDGLNSYITEYGTVSTANNIGTFSSNLSGSAFNLIFTPNNPQNTIMYYKIIREALTT